MAALALAWGLGPALPALLRGELLGHPWTDLYPAVWGLWASGQGAELLAARTELLGFPEGMGFAYSSPIKALLARPLLPLLGLVPTWNLLLIAARVATVATTWAAARAWGARPGGALLAAAVFACSPFFHGYAVEGIVEGTDGWTLALWAWALGRGRHLLAVPLMALTILSSWYLGAAGLVLCVLASPWRPGALLSLAGPLLAAPALASFLSAFPALAPLDPAVRAAMGTPLLPRAPGLLPGLSPFAISSWLGLLLPLLLALGRSRLAWLALVPWVLSLGFGPWYELPGLELLRFPYRLHAATLAILALAASRLPWPRLALFAPLIVAEGLLLSPVEPLLPGAPAEVPAIYARVDGPLLEIPSIVAMPPGQVNPSRARARFLFFYQAHHRQPSPWTPDFNGVGTLPGDAWLAPFAAWDPLVAKSPPEELEAGAVELLRGRGVELVMVQGKELGAERTRRLIEGLVAQGARVEGAEGTRTLLRVGGEEE